MKRFIITEEERREIRRLYFLEQQVPTGNTTTLNTKQAWESEIKKVEREIGNPSTWTIDSWGRLQETLKRYKKWMETSGGQADGGNKVNPSTYVVELPDHLKDYLATEIQNGTTFDSPQLWGAAIASVEGELGDPNTWTMDDYNRSQDILNRYKNWRENTPEGRAVKDSHNEPNEYVVPLPDHLKTVKDSD